MWRLKVKYRKGLVQLLLSRLLSFSLVLGLGFLLLVSLMINALVEGFMDQLREHFPHTAIMEEDFDQNIIDVNGASATIGIRLRF